MNHAVKENYSDCFRVTNENFRSWNEEMIDKYDPDVYHTRSNIFIKLIIKMLCKSMLGFLALKSGDRTLEVGCGAGNVLEKLARAKGLAKGLVGCDISLKLLQKARQRCFDDIFLVAADAGDLPFKSDSFNKILCTEVIEHLLEPEKCLAEIRRIADYGSIVVISTTNEPFVNKLKSIIWTLGFDKILFRKNDYIPEKKMDDEWHIHAFCPTSFKQILEKQFFVEEISFVPSILFPVQMVAKCILKR